MQIYKHLVPSRLSHKTNPVLLLYLQQKEIEMNTHYFYLFFSIISLLYVANNVILIKGNDKDKLKLDFCSKILGLDLSASVKLPEAIKKNFPADAVPLLNDFWRKRFSLC